MASLPRSGCEPGCLASPPQSLSLPIDGSHSVFRPRFLHGGQFPSFTESETSGLEVKASHSQHPLRYHHLKNLWCIFFNIQGMLKEKKKRWLRLHQALRDCSSAVVNASQASSHLIMFLLFCFVSVWFWPRCVACRILVPQLGIKPVPPTLGARSLNHWTAREAPSFIFRY